MIYDIAVQGAYKFFLVSFACRCDDLLFALYIQMFYSNFEQSIAVGLSFSLIIVYITHYEKNIKRMPRIKYCVDNSCQNLKQTSRESNIYQTKAHH